MIHKKVIAPFLQTLASAKEIKNSWLALGWYDIEIINKGTHFEVTGYEPLK